VPAPDIPGSGTAELKSVKLGTAELKTVELETMEPQAMGLAAVRAGGLRGRERAGASANGAPGSARLRMPGDRRQDRRCEAVVVFRGY
jgi:hypothetical protein